MTPWLQDADVTLYHGDVLDVLRELPAESVDCVVTSPPYWGLRDYGNEGQIGLEETPDAYVATMVDVFREVRRVLAAHGTCWVNLGDSYAGSGPSGASYQSETTKRRAEGDGTDGNFRVSPRLAERGLTYADKKPVAPPGLKPKDLVGIPWRVAFALQADGWWLRSDIIWAKPNPMPESVTDRPTKSHEYVFLLTKQPRYWFDQEAVREGYDDGWRGRLDGGTGSNGRIGGPGGFAAKGPDGRRKTTVVGQDGSEQHRDGERWPNPAGRNVRSVWTVATQPYPEAHFATYPEELVRRCVLAGCPERVCTVCGKPSERIVETNNPSKYAADDKTLGWANTHSKTSNAQSSKSLHRNPGGVYSSAVDLGWSDCGHNTWRPGLVLDPFAGSGTTCKVARDHGRHSIGIDLSADYLKLAARRLQQQSLFSEVT